jgi:hypothetical protein
VSQHYNPRTTNVGDLIFYLDAVNLKSYPGSGSTWYDLSANKNNFTLFNTPTYTSNGSTGTYLTFNGSNQYARSTNAINFNAYSAITIEIGYRTTVTNATQILYETTGTGGSTATGGITLLMNSNNTGTAANTYLSQWQGYGTRLFGYTVSTSTAFNSVIEQFVNGADTLGRQTYVNNTVTTYFTNTSVVSIATTTTSGLAFANTWTYIASRASTSNFFRGDIAYVRAWGKKISTPDITTNQIVLSARQPDSYPTPTIIAIDSSVGVLSGSVLYQSTGTFSWTAPAGVTSVSVVCVGGGASASGYFGVGGGGGALAYKNNITVVPGNSYTVVVGAGGLSTGGSNNVTGVNGGASSFTAGFGTMTAGGGTVTGGATANSGSATGGVPSGVYDGGGNGGGCPGPYSGGASAGASTSYYGSGGGGAGGYSGNGGSGGGSGSGSGSGSYTSATAGSGGGGGGGQGQPQGNSPTDWNDGGGGGVGVYGQGASGSAGTQIIVYNSAGHCGGYGGSGGGDGVSPSANTTSGNGGNYGGGGGSFHGYYTTFVVGRGANGAVRIIWGSGRAFPSTGDLSAINETVI